MMVHDRPRGSIPSRNALAASCTNDLFVSLDDDSYPLDTDFIAQVRELFVTSRSSLSRPFRSGRTSFRKRSPRRISARRGKSAVTRIRAP